MGREAAAACSPKPKLRRGLWSPEEDEKLYNHIIRYGVGCWSSVPKLAGLERCGKSCRLRWINYLRPDLKRGSFSQQEEELIISLHKILGNRWSQIASQLPGRTDNEIKNFWNSCIKKKLRQRGIDPSTHKPLNDDGAGAGAEQEDVDKKQQQHYLPADDGCFAICGPAGSDSSLAPPHSPAVSFDPLSVTNVPTTHPSSPYAAAEHSFRSDTLCNYGGSGGGVDVVSDAGTYSAYTTGGDSSSNSNSTAWTCGNVVVGGAGEPLPHMVDMFGRDAEPPHYPFDPARFSPWNHHHHHEPTPPQRLDGGGGAASFPIRSLSRDMPESCFDLGRGALDDEFSVDFL
ncbi:hypothetical protein E2562_027621 [Oryza meyeriana var. granulata]|uniref:Uncharacterized protein n=1 Tax=Oryza meyeriana var. granulata TaxID=110450 RepID=A0A6G1E3J1_9ORYZ|nr:hypothetical protein E2562_027621 [Oryza meyeriana var. granulata]